VVEAEVAGLALLVELPLVEEVLVVQAALETLALTEQTERLVLAVAVAEAVLDQQLRLMAVTVDQVS
jgi:hypothetical protein